jgi:hypothetical protein
LLSVPCLYRDRLKVNYIRPKSVCIHVGRRRATRVLPRRIDRTSSSSLIRSCGPDEKQGRKGMTSAVVSSLLLVLAERRRDLAQSPSIADVNLNEGRERSHSHPIALYLSTIPSLDIALAVHQVSRPSAVLTLIHGLCEEDVESCRKARGFLVRHPQRSSMGQTHKV